MEERRHLGGGPHRPPGEATDRRGAGADAQRGRDRQPERQDDPKGGPPDEKTIGFDGGKKVKNRLFKGRKRHILVDTQGLLMAVKVTAADVTDQDGARQVLEPLGPAFPRMELVWADRGYAGDLTERTQGKLGWRIEVVEQIETKKDRHEQVMAEAKRRRDAGASVAQMYAGLTLKRDFQVLPRRWVVERTFAAKARVRQPNFAWLSQYRRLSKDYEYLPQSGEAMVYLAMTRLMLRRLAKLEAKRAGPTL